MSTVSPKIRAQFESMPIDLKNHILSMDVKLENMNDLMAVLERIVAEGEGQKPHGGKQQKELQKLGKQHGKAEPELGKIGKKQLQGTVERQKKGDGQSKDRRGQEVPKKLSAPVGAALNVQMQSPSFLMKLVENVYRIFLLYQKLRKIQS